MVSSPWHIFTRTGSPLSSANAGFAGLRSACLNGFLDGKALAQFSGKYMLVWLVITLVNCYERNHHRLMHCCTNLEVNSAWYLWQLLQNIRLPISALGILLSTRYFLSKLWGMELTERFRACLKIHFRQMHAPLRGIFEPNSGYVARKRGFYPHYIDNKCFFISKRNHSSLVRDNIPPLPPWLRHNPRLCPPVLIYHRWEAGRSFK